MDVWNIILFIFICIFSYLLGGVSIARLITKREKTGGINSQGSGNPGTMNMLRTHGMGLGLFTLFCDALKGAIPALIGVYYFGYLFGTNVGTIAMYLFGFFAVLGHIFPIYYKFKGGKGIATTFGVFMVADPVSTSILFVILFITLYFIKIGSIVSFLFISIDAIVQLFSEEMLGNWFAIMVMLFMIILDFYAHRANIARIIEDKENAVDLQESLDKDFDKLKSKKSFTDKKSKENDLHKKSVKNIETKEEETK